MTSSAAAAAARAHNGDGEASDDYFFDEQVNKTTQLTWPLASIHQPPPRYILLSPGSVTNHSGLRSPYLTLDLSSSCVKDTLGHTSTPAFSVDSELLRYFPGHAVAFQILLCGVSPVLSWSSSSRLSLCTTYIPVYSLSWQSVVVHSHHVPSNLSLLSFMMRSISSAVSAPWPSRSRGIIISRGRAFLGHRGLTALPQTPWMGLGRFAAWRERELEGRGEGRGRGGMGR